MYPPTPIPGRVIELVQSIKAEMDLLQAADSDEARSRARGRIVADLAQLEKLARGEARRGARLSWVSWALRQVSSQLSAELISKLLRLWPYNLPGAYGNREQNNRCFAEHRASRVARVRRLFPAATCSAA